MNDVAIHEAIQLLTSAGDLSAMTEHRHLIQQDNTASQIYPCLSRSTEGLHVLDYWIPGHLVVQATIHLCIEIHNQSHMTENGFIRIHTSISVIAFSTVSDSRTLSFFFRKLFLSLHCLPPLGVELGPFEHKPESTLAVQHPNPLCH